MGCPWRRGALLTRSVASMWHRNVRTHGILATRNPDCDELRADDGFESLENCLYYYLVDREREVTRDGRKLYLEPPITNGEVLTLTLDHLTIRRVELAQKTSSQFNIYGEFYLSWTDPRLEWDEKEWKMEEFTLHDNHHIWIPTLSDESYSRQKNQAVNFGIKLVGGSESKILKLTFVQAARFHLRYPEEENDCCLFFSAGDYEQMLKFEIKTESKTAIGQTVAMETAGDGTVLSQNEHSAWIVEETEDSPK
ncbi:unnamed protein product [Toxocara canis]|uniref:Neur_chan_LBD domain-containing protein n=1 Tax=Toxocara canis TaxID=6265 RepID=A0A183V6C2_TOXCA|nr:unnamed protein product [Toxocara canis]